jgi:quercetin dioxygenase-like cupin family protein
VVTCGVTSTDRDSGASGIMHLHQTETYIVVSGSGTLVTGGEIMNGRQSAPESSVTTTLNGPSCSGQIVGDWVAKHVKEGDIIIMPAGTPHGWLDVPVHVDYLSVRPDPDRVLPSDYINPALGSDFEMRTR